MAKKSAGSAKAEKPRRTRSTGKLKTPSRQEQSRRVDQIVRMLILRHSKYEITATFENLNIPSRTIERYITRARKRIRGIVNRSTEDVVDEAVAYWTLRRREADQRFQYARQKVIDKEAEFERLNGIIANYPKVGLSEEEAAKLADLYEQRSTAMQLVGAYRTDRQDAQDAADAAQKHLTHVMGAMAPMKVLVGVKNADKAMEEEQQLQKLAEQPITQADAMVELLDIKNRVIQRMPVVTAKITGPTPEAADKK